MNSIFRGHRFFDPLDSTAEIGQNDVRISDSDVNPLYGKIFTMNTKGTYGKLKKVKEGWLLLKGAQAQSRNYKENVKDPSTVNYITTAISYLNDKLDHENKTIEDILFSSPSTAVVALAQRTSNGWKEWKDDEGKFLDCYRDTQN